jgi:hypothetical protein
MKNSVLVLLFGTVLLTAQTPKSDAREAVKQVPRIFVAELHFPTNPDWDGLVRSKLISSLVQDCGAGCTVVEAVGPTQDDDGDGANGVLTGDILVQSPDQRHYRVQGAMRLVDKSGKYCGQLRSTAVHLPEVQHPVLRRIRRKNFLPS